MNFIKRLLSPLFVLYARLFVLYAEPLGLGGGGAMYWPAVSPLDANLMFVACDMGGLYRTTDGGARWTLLDQRQVRGAPAGPVVCDPNDVNVVLAWSHTSEPGRTFLKRSTDKGNSWTALAVPPGATRITALGVDRAPIAGGSTYRLLCGTDAGPFYSDDIGQTWTAAPGTAGATVGVLVVPDAATGAYLYFLASSADVYRSLDRGQSWQAAGGVPLPAIDSFSGGGNGAFAPSVMLYATGGGSFTSSSDGGATWSAALAGSYSLVGASDGNPHVVYAGTAYPQIVRKSTDRGQTWADSLNNGNPPLRNGWIEHDRGWGFGGGANGLAVSRSDANVEMMTNAGAVYRTTNGSAWNQVYSAPAGTSAPGQPWRSVGLEVTTTYFYDVDPANPQLHYISYTDVGFARSDDGGNRWYSIPPTNPWKNAPYNTIYQIAFDPANPGDFWAAASGVHDIPQPRYLQDVQVPGEGWLPPGSGGVVRRSGNSWTDHNAGLPQRRVAKSWNRPQDGAINGVPPVVSIVVDPNNANRRWCAVFGEGVYAWDNAAGQWVKRSTGLGFPNNMNVYRLRYLDDGTANGVLFCSVTARRDNTGAFLPESGLFRSTDGGLNWVNLTASQPAVRYAADYGVSPVDPNTIFLATINRPGADGALYRTTNGMAAAPQWTLVFDISSVPQTPIGPLHWPYLGCFSVTIDPAQPLNVFLCTLTHGVWLSRAGGDAGTWNEFAAIPFLATHRLVIHQAASRWLGAYRQALYITTFGAGVWRVGVEWWFWRWFCRWWPWPLRWLRWPPWPPRPKWWPCWPWYWPHPIPWWLERNPLPWRRRKVRASPAALPTGGGGRGRRAGA